MTTSTPVDPDTIQARPEVDVALARQILEMVHVQIRNADEKIRALFSGSALLAAALALNSGQSLQGFMQGGLTMVEIIKLSSRAMLLLAVAASVITAVLALLPRIVPGKSLRTHFFFGHIAATEHDQYVTELLHLSRQEALAQLASQIHVNSVIVRAKYLWTYRSATLLVVAILIWIGVQILEFAV